MFRQPPIHPPNCLDIKSQHHGNRLHLDPQLLHLMACILAGWACLKETAPCRFSKLFYRAGILPLGRPTPQNGKVSPDGKPNTNLDPVEALIPKILDYMLHLKHARLAFRSLKVHLAAMSACHAPVQSYFTFSHLIILKFLKGLFHTYPQIRDLSPDGNSLSS